MELNIEMQSATENLDGKRIEELSQQMHLCQVKIDKYFETLENLSMIMEEKQQIFDKKLNDLEKLEISQFS